MLPFTTKLTKNVKFFVELEDFTLKVNLFGQFWLINK